MVTTILIGTIINAAFTALLGLIISFLLGYLIRHILANAKIGHWRNLYDERDSEYKELDGRYNERNRLVGKLEKEVGSWKTKLDPLNLQIDGLKGDVSERDGIIAKFKNAPDWEAQHSTLKIDVDRQADEIGILKSQKVELEKEAEDLKRKSSTIGAATDDLKKQLDEWRQKYEGVQPNLKGRDDELGELKITVAGKDAFIAELKTKVATLERNQADPESVAANESALSAAKSKASDLAERLADCNSKRTSLETTNGDLLKQVETAKASAGVAATAGVAAVGVSASGADTSKLEADNKKLQEDLEKSHNEYNNLVAKNSELEGTLKKLKDSEGASTAAPVVAAAPSPAPASTGDAKKDEALNRIREKAKDIDFGRIGQADANSKDDLKDISGIGPFLETKLNTLGIYTFKQIANFNDEDIDKVNDAIEFFPGRIRRDDWVGQAKKMIA